MATFNYTSREFSKIKSDLLARASSSLPEWTDRSSSDFMSALIDLWAYSADVLHFYIDRAATEAFLTTATQRDSVLALANLYDYTPNFRSSATVSVNFTNNGATSVTVPSGTRLYALIDNERYNFYTTYSAIVPAASTLSISCSQGTQLFDQTLALTDGSSASNGTPNQRFSIRDINVVPLSLTVDVYEGVNASAVRWQYDTNLASSSASDATYNIYVSADGYTQIVFGNGVNGRIPPANAVVKASYAISDGPLGNVSPMTITNLYTPIANITVQGNPSAAVGGSDVEGIDSIKRNLPYVFRTQGRAVSLSDYEDLALQVQGVSKARAVYNGSGANGGSVTVHVISYQSDFGTAASVSSPITIDPTLRSTVAATLTQASMLGVAAISVPSTITTDRVKISMDLQVKGNYVRQWVQEAVGAAVATLFDFDSATFGGRLNLGDVYRTVMDVPGVDYVAITAFNKVGDASIATSVTAASTRLLQSGIVTISSLGGVTPPVV
jgi:uncharacterized phage protein gp47/JayE